MRVRDGDMNRGAFNQNFYEGRVADAIVKLGLENVAEVTPSRERNTVAVWTDEMCHEGLHVALTAKGIQPKSIYTTKWIVSQWDDDVESVVYYDERVIAVEF